MSCTPTNIFVDNMLWNKPEFFSYMMRLYQNYTPGDEYDCGMKTLHCGSEIAQAMTFSDEYNNLVYWFDVIVSYFITTVFIITGLTVNTANVAIFSTNKIANDSTNFLLLAVSLSDLFMCLAQVSLLIVCYLCFFDTSLAISGYTVIALQVFNLNRWLSLLSLDFITLLAVQRAGAVLIPFKAALVFSYRNTKIITFIIGIVFISTAAPFFTYQGPVWVFHPYFNKSIALIVKYRNGFSMDWMLEYELRYASNRYVIDLIITIVSVTITVIKLKLQSRSRESLQAGKTRKTDVKSKSSSSKREDKVMKMSLTVCFLTFMVYGSLTIVYKVLAPVIASTFTSLGVAIIFFSGKVFAVFGSSFNFFIYIKMSTPFKNAFNNLFAGRS